MKKYIFKQYDKIIHKFGLNNITSLINNASWLISGKLINLVLSFITAIVVIRYLGPEQYGSLSYALAFIAFFNSFVIMGLDNIVVKELSMGINEEENVLSTALLIQIISSIFTFIIAIVAIFIFSENFYMRLYVTILAIPFLFRIFALPAYWFQSKLKSKYFALIQNMNKMIFTVISITFVLLKFDLILFIILNSIIMILNSIGVFLISLKHDFKLSILKIRKNLLIKYLRLGFFLVIAGFGSLIFLRIDQIMIGEFLGEYQLGIYSSAVKLAELWYFIPISIAASVLPFLSKEKNEQKYMQSLYKYMKLLVAIGYLVAIVITIFSKHIIGLLYGEEYIDASLVLSIYMWSGIFIGLALARNTYLITTDRVKLDMNFNIIGAVFNIGLNIWLIPMLGLNGAAIATLISYCIYGFLSTFIFKSVRHIAFMQIKSLFLKK